MSTTAKPDDPSKPVSTSRSAGDEFEIDGYGQRIDGLIPLAEARAMFDEAADDAWRAAEDAEESIEDPRPKFCGGTVYPTPRDGQVGLLGHRDATGDLQISCSKGDLKQMPRLAGNWITAMSRGRGPHGRTRRARFVFKPTAELASKSLSPSRKWHGPQDPELRARRRHVDLFTNPEVLQLHRPQPDHFFHPSSHGCKWILGSRTPMMHPVRAVTRTFTTHHNALGMPLFLRLPRAVPRS